MWLNFLSAAAAVFCLGYLAGVLRRQLAVMDPAAKRAFYLKSTSATLAGVIAFAAVYYYATRMAH